MLSISSWTFSLQKLFRKKVDTIYIKFFMWRYRKTFWTNNDVHIMVNISSPESFSIVLEKVTNVFWINFKVHDHFKNQRIVRISRIQNMFFSIMSRYSYFFFGIFSPKNKSNAQISRQSYLFFFFFLNRPVNSKYYSP